MVLQSEACGGQQRVAGSDGSPQGGQEGEGVDREHPGRVEDRRFPRHPDHFRRVQPEHEALHKRLRSGVLPPQDAQTSRVVPRAGVNRGGVQVAAAGSSRGGRVSAPACGGVAPDLWGHVGLAFASLRLPGDGGHVLHVCEEGPCHVKVGVRAVRCRGDTHMCDLDRTKSHDVMDSRQEIKLAFWKREDQHSRHLDLTGNDGRQHQQGPKENGFRTQCPISLHGRILSTTSTQRRETSTRETGSSLK